MVKILYILCLCCLTLAAAKVARNQKAHKAVRPHAPAKNLRARKTIKPRLAIPLPKVKQEKAKLGQFPFMARISYQNMSANGIRAELGILISNRHVLAKAEFVQHWENVEVALGAVQPFLPKQHHQVFHVYRDAFILPKNITEGYDLAIIPLPQDAKINQYVKPALLPKLSEKGRSYTGEMGTLLAWFQTSVPAKLYLVFTKVEIESFQRCGYKSDMGTICLTQLTDKSLQNGSPLVMQTSDGPVVIGIFSFVNVLVYQKQEIHTFIFIKVNNHLDFIAENTNINLRP